MLYHYIALIDAEKQTQAQFREAPHADPPVVERERRTVIAAPLRFRISAALYALANAIEPGASTPDTAHAR